MSLQSLQSELRWQALEHPESSLEDLVKGTYRMSGAVKDDFEEDWCPYTFLEDFDDFTDQLVDALGGLDELPLSMQISMAVDTLIADEDFESIKNAYLSLTQAVEAATYHHDDDYYMDEDFTDDALNRKEYFAPDQSVTSSSIITDIGYAEGKLRVFFNNGSGYEYDVDPETMEAMQASSSKGQFLWNVLRGPKPGRVIDNPNKITPGGVGGSIVPYFKIKGAKMSPEAMRSSIDKFLSQVRKGPVSMPQAGGFGAGRTTAKVAKVSKKTQQQWERFTNYKVWQKFIDKTSRPSFKSGLQRLIAKLKRKPKGSKLKKRLAAFKKKGTDVIVKPGAKSGLEKEKEQELSDEEQAIRKKIEALRKMIIMGVKMGLDDTAIASMRAQVKRLLKQLESDFVDVLSQGGIAKDNVNVMVGNYTADNDKELVIPLDDMKHIDGPITRAGAFEYRGKIKVKDWSNLKDVFDTLHHLPIFDSHKERSIIGFAYDFTPNEEEKRMYAKGYLFSDIEDLSDIPIDMKTKFPVSIRFFDRNTSDSGQQDISDVVHLAFDPTAKEVDRCSSAGGLACYMKLTAAVSDYMPKDEKKEMKDESDEENTSEEKDDKDKKKVVKKKEDDKKDTSDFTVSKAEYDKIVAERNTLKDSLTSVQKDLKDVGDFVTTVKAEREAARTQKMEQLKSDLLKENQTFTINSDFMKECSDFNTIELISKAVQSIKPAEKKDEEIDPFKILPLSDFENKIASISDRIKADQKTGFGF